MLPSGGPCASKVKMGSPHGWVDFWSVGPPPWGSALQLGAGKEVHVARSGTPGHASNARLTAAILGGGRGKNPEGSPWVLDTLGLESMLGHWVTLAVTLLPKLQPSHP